MHVVIAEEETLLRQGLQQIMQQFGFDVDAAVTDTEQVERAVNRHHPNIVISDIRMPPTHTDEGLREALHIRAAYPQTAVMVLSQDVQRRDARELLDGHPGGVGYLLQQRIADVDTFCADVSRVAAGGTALDPVVVAVMVARSRLTDGGVGRLAPRQREVLSLMAEGRGIAWIASQLRLGEHAVEQHTADICEALGLPAGDDHQQRVFAVIRYLAG
ncbi:response regulator transcription factor [Rathayibacter soli]|uniref:response regulator transcription factor n=1 Tax=Rathayibacter soli TaxID=3144168 RepID=UPI0027E537B8|nr:response regulator transcription factor [Glaciibacter superstes]